MNQSTVPIRKQPISFSRDLLEHDSNQGEVRSEVDIADNVARNANLQYMIL